MNIFDVRLKIESTYFLSQDFIENDFLIKIF
jgi:hypothetical protein